MPQQSFSVLKIRDFRLLVAARILIVMTTTAQAVVVGWQVYSITKNPFMLGLTGLAEALPALLCALFAGHIVDVCRPHRVYLSCIGALVLNSFILFMLAGGVVAAPGGNVLPWIFAGIFISGIARSFIMPSSFALLPQIVPREQISSAAAWSGSGFQVASIAGPAIAGIIYGGYGVTIAWALPLSLVICAFVTLCAISNVNRHYKSESKREPAAQSIKAGWKFILSNEIMLPVMALDMFAVLFGGAVSMLPAYADQVLHVGSEGLGALRAAPAMGAIFSALIMAVKPFKKIHGSTLLWMIFGFGLCIIGFGLSKIFWLSMFFLAMSGTFDSVSAVLRSTMMQWLTPDNMRGRVSSVNSMFIISSNELGAFESGLAARLLGLVPSVVLGGVAAVIVVAITAMFSPGLRRAEVNPKNI
jgi:MFS family permease